MHIYIYIYIIFLTKSLLVTMFEIWMWFLQVLPLGVDLGVTAMKEYTTFFRATGAVQSVVFLSNSDHWLEYFYPSTEMQSAYITNRQGSYFYWCSNWFFLFLMRTEDSYMRKPILTENSKFCIVFQSKYILHRISKQIYFQHLLYHS